MQSIKQSEADACIALPKEPTISPSFIAQLAKKAIMLSEGQELFLETPRQYILN